MAGIPRPTTVSTKQQRIAELAKQAPSLSFTTLAHHIDVQWLHEAYQRTRRDGATGVDGQTAADYAVNLEANLQSLLDRAKSGTYRAPPVRRVHIPKESGKETRPIGIPTFEDKVLQRAVVMVLGPLYEQDFQDCSYGQVLEAVRQRLKECRLELHPEKTKIVYCQDTDRKGQHEHITFDFLGYTFRPRRAKNRWGKFFV